VQRVFSTVRKISLLLVDTEVPVVKAKVDQFAELKNQIGLRRLRLRRMRFVREQFFLAAVVQNIKRLARFLVQLIPPAERVPA
jgi:hypothetical protein